MSISIRENEKIIKSVRQDALVLLPSFVEAVVFIALLITWRYWGNFEFYNYWPWVISISLVLFVILIFWKWVKWKKSVFLVTDQRVVVHLRTGPFSTQSIDLLYRDINEVSYSKQGIFSAIGNYGDIHLSTASGTTHKLDHMRDPEDVVAMINKIR